MERKSYNPKVVIDTCRELKASNYDDLKACLNDYEVVVGVYDRTPHYDFAVEIDSKETLVKYAEQVENHLIKLVGFYAVKLSYDEYYKWFV